MLKQDSEQSDQSEDDALQDVGLLSVFRVREKISSNSIQFKILKDSLTCPICLYIFTEPVYIKDCSHRFCKSCIEKYIRQQEKKKSCPTCRRKIGTKRQLRVDENIMLLMQTIFDNVELYTQQEEAQCRRESEKMIFKPNPNGSLQLQKQTKSYDESFNLATPQKRQYNRKRVKTNEPQMEKRPSEQQEVKQEAIQEDIQEKFATEQLEKSKQLIKSGTPYTISFQLQRHPDSLWVKQIEQNILAAPSTITVNDLGRFVCYQLNLNEDKYSQNIRFYHDLVLLGPLDKTLTLAYLSSYWDCLQDVYVYNPNDMMRNFMEGKQSLGKKCQLYYNIVFT